DASVMSDPQATDREQQLLAELETLRVTCAELETLGVTRAEVSGRGQARPLQDSSSQTQDERRLLQPESKEQDWECEQGDGERRADEGNLSSDVTGDR
ncbi:hypothetical protein GDO81_025795, partial [Engystomops pustulosus]